MTPFAVDRWLNRNPLLINSLRWPVRADAGLANRRKLHRNQSYPLIAAGQDFSYEKRLELGGEARYPDFTIEDEISGRTIYWEHLGMLEKRSYSTKWQKKLAWYIKNGVFPESEGGGANGMLVTSEGSGSTAFNAAEIQATIKRLF